MLLSADKQAQLEDVLEHLRLELTRAMTKHSSMNSAHEGISVIKEEVDELWDHVKKDTGQCLEARKEALQIAAMGIRYVLDLTYPASVKEAC